MILGFKLDFVPQIISGTKVHTIRAGRRWVAGQTISFCINLGPDNLTKFQPDGVAQTVQDIRAVQINGIYLIEIDGRIGLRALVRPRLRPVCGPGPGRQRHTSRRLGLRQG